MKIQPNSPRQQPQQQPDKPKIGEEKQKRPFSPENKPEKPERPYYEKGPQRNIKEEERR